ncbi:MAG: potassium channel family protein, partial [Thermodesulfovibrionales bacterium]|nr:potassium channel family protein [Thermodesulfovibrionales bacterium]
MKELRKRLVVAAGMIWLVILFGTTGYMVIEGWSFWDSFYMTVITLTTVGYREIHELSFRGELFTVVLLIGGVGTVLYALSAGAKILLEGELQEIYGRKRVEKKLRNFKDHFIVCGYGRMGKVIARELEHEKLQFIVIEKNEVLLDADRKEELLVIQGDATNDDLLKKAGIEKAQCLISVLPTDAENLYVVLSARGLNPKL